MKLMILLFTLSTVFVLVTDHSGTYTYKISTPDGTIEGKMVLTSDGDSYKGTITAYGNEYEITDVEMEGNNFNFKTFAAGYSSVVKGKFEEGTYHATIHVEGIQIPLKAVKE